MHASSAANNHSDRLLPHTGLCGNSRPMYTPRNTSGKRATPPGPLQRLKCHDGSDALYGSIRFAGTRGNPSKWCAVSHRSEVGDVVKLMLDTWKLKPPRVIISVTGAAASTLEEMKSKDKQIFRRGLKIAAQRTGAWIVTGGTNHGVMKVRCTSRRPLDCRRGVAALHSHAAWR